MELLSKAGWLATTSPAFRQAVLSRCDAISVRAGDVIYRSEEATGGLFGVTSGKIELHLPGLRDDHTLCHIGGPGYWFGDLAALSGLPRRFDVVAGSHCVVARLPRAELQRVLDNEPEGWRNVALLVNGNLDLAVRVVEALKQQAPAARIALSLRNLVGTARDIPHRITATQAEIAAIAGLSRRVANTILHRLEAAGVIRMGYGWIDVMVEASQIVRHAPE